MIAGIFHQGSGLGDQLFRYITTRTLAEEKGLDWGMVNPATFKGASFMNIDTGKPLNLLNPLEWNEKQITENGIDIRSYDPEINFVEDYTIIDGCFEDEKYWGHNLANIRDWLRVEPLNLPDDLCIIGFRGGEYYTDPNLGLPKEYYDEAIKIIRRKYEGRASFDMRFEVHTDDPVLAKQFFPKYKIVQDIGLNWRSVRYAKHQLSPMSCTILY